MSIGIFILCLVAGPPLVAILVRILHKLRLTIPLVYFVIAVISTLFTRWTTENEQLVMTGFFILVALAALSWIITLVKWLLERRAATRSAYTQIQRAMASGMTTFQFDENGFLIQPE